MSEPRDVLDRLRADGVQLWVHDGRLRYRPHGALNSDRLGELRTHKAAILRLLREEPVPADEPMAGPTEATDLPLSYAQEGLWFLEQLQQLGSAYNIVSVLRLVGDLDVAALRRALDEIVRRHAILRTRFHSVDGVGIQSVHSGQSEQLELVDLSHVDVSEQVALVDEHLNRHATKRFDLDSGCPFQAQLLRLAGNEHLFVINVHHLVFDGASTEVFYRELGLLYEAYRAGAVSQLPEPTAQYGDYARWQRREHSDVTLERELKYWRDRLAAAPDDLSIPLDHPRPPVPDFRGDLFTVDLPAELSVSVRQLAQRHDATPFMVLLAAYHALLSRWSGQEDVCVGVPVDSRGHRDADALIGCFLNTVVIRADLSGGPNFARLLRQVRDRVVEAYDHRHLPFHRLVAELRPERGTMRQPLFQVMFAYLRQDALRLGELESTVVEPPGTAAKFDLSLFVADTATELRATFEYATSLFHRATIERLAGRFVRLLEHVVADPERPIGELPLLSDAERHEQLVEWNATEVDLGRPRCVPELIEEQAARHPDRIAVVFAGEKLSYAQLDACANRVANRLRAHGVGPDSLVAVCLERSIELVVGLLAVLKAGAAYVPLDPTYPPERRAFMLADSGAAMLLTHEHLRSTVDSIGQVLTLDGAARDIGERVDNPSHGPAPDNLAYVIYTSGSTGRPKGVAVSHRSIRNRIDWGQRTYRLRADDTVLHKTPISFDISVWELFWPLAAGARLVVAEPDGHRDPGYLRRLINQERVTTVHFVPSMLDAFLTGTGRGECPTLRRVICSGEELTRELVGRFFDVVDCELHNLYGPTEAAVEVSAWPCAPGETGRVPIGRPVQNTRLYVLDDALNLVPAGTVGQLHIGGIQLARGYLGRPELTAERFVPDPFGSPGSRLYRTGDLARFRSDGAVEFLGRIDHQVKVRGFRIELGEVESVVRRCPSVRDAVVVVREDRPGDRRLVAYLVGQGVDVAEVERFVRPALPEYMIPSAFVPLAELPLTANGKVDRRALPAVRDLPAAAGFAGPRSTVEVALVDIWREVLGVESVGVDDSFFMLGGHSLLAIQVVARVRQRLGVEVALHEFYSAPTVTELAHLVAIAELVREDPIVPVSSDTMAASAAQQHIWWLEQGVTSPGLFTIDAGLTTRLRELSARSNATLFMTFTAAFTLLVHRLSDQDDVCFGYFVGNRDLVDHMFAAHLAQVRDSMLAADQHRDLPFSLVEQESATAKRGLKLSVSEPGADGCVLAELEFATELFERETVRRLASRFTTLLEAVVDNPLADLSDSFPGVR